MLMPIKIDEYAKQLLHSRASAKLILPYSESEALSVMDGYEIGQRIYALNIAQGFVSVGRRIGFEKSITSPAQHVTPIWAHVYATTVRYARDNRGIQSLEGALQPRIEPGIVFSLNKTPAPDALMEEIAECIEWMAHAFEIVVCPYQDWKCTLADAIAAFGLHGTLIIGEPHVLSAATRRNLADVLANASISLSCCTEESVTLCGAGFGSDMQDSPVYGLWHLHRELIAHPQFSRLQAGEIIASGTWTEAYPVQAGQTWVTAFSGIALPGLTVSFV